jgi:hypothetical protein
VPFLRVKGDWRASNPPPNLINSPNTSNQNIERAMLFSTVERPTKYVSGDVGDINLPTVLREKAVSYTICLLSVYSIYYWERGHV